VTVTLPDAGGRFLSLQVVDADQYTATVRYDAGSYGFTGEQIGTRYLLMAVRILVDPNREDDLDQVHALQDALGFEQPGGPGRWEVPAWDTTSQKKVRDALLTLAETIPDTKRMFGTREQVDPIRHLIGTATGWGGNPETEALYLNVTPEQSDGPTVYRLTVPAEVPVDGFWSITVYDAKGHLIPNEQEMYAVSRARPVTLRVHHPHQGQLRQRRAGRAVYLACGPARRPGAATFYVLSARGGDGEVLDGSASYRLRVPTERFRPRCGQISGARPLRPDAPLPSQR
jgi:hypothetical protein